MPDVVARLQALERAPRGDGVACFAKLYREVTEQVAADLASGTFADTPFLGRLDVAFANLFFAAVEGPAPPAWAPLFESRSGKGIAPLQFALAGMNAHINRDLPVAVVSTCHELGVELRDRSPEHRDFVRVNALLAAVEAKVKREYTTGLLGVLDRLVHRVGKIDDVIAMWDVDRARDAAWTNALTMWELRGEKLLADGFLLALDRMVGLASRGLLAPRRLL